MQQDLYSVKTNIVKADIGTMSLAYLPDIETFFVLNKTAGMLLTILEQGKSRSNLIRALDSLYPNVEKRVKERHVDSFLHLVIDHKIAVPAEKGRVRFERIKLPDVSEGLEMPIISSYEKKWVIQNHPDAVYDIAFSDTWSPASGGFER